MNQDLRPRQRSQLRRAAGTAFTAKRYVSGIPTAIASPGSKVPTNCPGRRLRTTRCCEAEGRGHAVSVQQNHQSAGWPARGWTGCLKPGQTFSYWKCIVTPPGARAMWTAWCFIAAPGPGVGGGLCQLSNLIYWMTLHTPLTVTERYRHSYDVFPDANRTQPFWLRRHLCVSVPGPDGAQRHAGHLAAAGEGGRPGSGREWRCTAAPRWSTDCGTGAPACTGVLGGFSGTISFGANAGI